MFCDICGANAPNQLYCMNCGKYRPTDTAENPEPVPNELRIMRGTMVEFDYWHKTRRAKIKKILRVNVEVQVVTKNRKRKTVRIPIKNLRVPT